MQGNFDLILTGNWDDFFERAALLLAEGRDDGRNAAGGDSGGSCGGGGGGGGGGVSSGRSAAATTASTGVALTPLLPASQGPPFPASVPESILRVRYRADVETLFAELQGQKRFGNVPCIFKHHGDFSSAGIGEFVMKFEDYRDMVSKQKQTVDFMQWVMCSKSLLFYGYSLSVRTQAIVVFCVVKIEGTLVGA